jgi:WD40 repeat protein
LASTSTDGTIKLWNAETGAEIRTLTGHADGVLEVAFSPDGKQLASASADKTLKLWDAATGVEIRTFVGHADVVWSVAFSPDGRRLVSSGRDRALKIWDAQSGAELLTVRSCDEGPAIFSSDGRWLACGVDGAIAVMDSVELSPDERMGHFLAKRIVERHPQADEALAEVQKRAHWNNAMRAAAVKYIEAAHGR